MKTYKFQATILKHDSIDAAYIEFPFDVNKEFGTNGQVKVKALFDNYEYRGSLAKMGHHCHCLGLTKKVRDAIGKQPGDSIHVEIIQDNVPRVVEIPEDLQLLLNKHPQAKDFFAKLSYTNQKEYVNWINSAKKEETRQSRLEQTITLLLEGKKNYKSI